MKTLRLLTPALIVVSGITFFAAAHAASCSLIEDNEVRRNCERSERLTSAHMPSSSSSRSSSSKASIASSRKNGKSSSTKSGPAISSSALSLGREDTLPYGEPTSSFIVLGHESPVIDACKTQFSAWKFVVDHLGDLGPLNIYDLNTHRLLVSGVKKTDTNWAGLEKTHLPYYARIQVRDFTDEETGVAALSENHRMSLSGMCEGKASPLGFRIVPSAITDIKLFGPENAVLTSGNNAPIGSFQFIGQKASKAKPLLQLKTVTFLAKVTQKLALSNIIISRGDTAALKTGCLYNNAPYITCDLPDYMSDVYDSTIFNLSADVALTTTNGSLQLILNEFGSPLKKGSVSWKNFYETFDWISPLQREVRGTLYQR